MFASTQNMFAHSRFCIVQAVSTKPNTVPTGYLNSDRADYVKLSITEVMKFTYKQQIPAVSMC